MLMRALVLAVVLGAPFTAYGADLPPYEANYELRLTRASATFGPRAAAGTYQYRVAQTCDGWETKSHIQVELTFRDDITFSNERFFSSWEAKAGNTYKFAVQTIKNGNTVEAFKGTAMVAAKGGQVIYEPLADPNPRKPVKKVTLQLPAGTLLPLAHARALLEHAEAGDPLFRSVVMNGSYSSGPRVLSAAIGPRHGALPPSLGADFDPQLLATPNWEISTAVYNLGEKRDVPNSESEIQLYESGIVENFEQTFFDYALSAHLTSLRRLPPPACG